MAKKITPPYIPSVVSLLDVSHIANIVSLLWGNVATVYFTMWSSDSYDDVKW